jgi:chemosensory pili system protein ChpA (sensor histidine kinase/response regulator)
MPGSIFLVDDELHVAQILGRRLEREGYSIETARDGVEAFDRIAESLPDVIISDLQMPRLDGLGLAEQLKADPRTASIPIVMLTSRGHRADDETVSRTNIVRLIAKPFSSHEMVKVVGEVFAGLGGESAEAA